MKTPEETISYEEVKDLTYVEQPSKFWQKTRSNFVIKLSNIARCNGNITRREKLPGKRRRI
jgi:hypothetical protein